MRLSVTVLNCSGNSDNVCELSMRDWCGTGSWWRGSLAPDLACNLHGTHGLWASNPIDFKMVRLLIAFHSSYSTHSIVSISRCLGCVLYLFDLVCQCAHRLWSGNPIDGQTVVILELTH